MRHIILTLILSGLIVSFLKGQGTTTPTIAPQAASQVYCLNSANYTLLSTINTNGFPGTIDHFIVQYGSPAMHYDTIPYPAPPTISYTYDLSSFYGGCLAYQSSFIGLYTYTANDPIPLNSSFYVTFRNPPNPQFTFSNNTPCVGQNVTLNSSYCAANNSYLWGTGATTGSIVVNQTTPGTYTYSLTAMNVCDTVSISHSLMFYDSAQAVINATSGATLVGGNNYSVCLGSNGTAQVVLNGTNSLYETSYQWTASPPSWGMTIQNPTNQGTATIHFTQPGTYTIRLRVNNQCNVYDNAFINFQVYAQPQLSLAAVSDPCIPVGNTYPYTPTPYNPQATYTINGVTVNSFPYNITSTSTPTQYAISATFGNPCNTLTRLDTFVVSPPVPVSFQTADFSICQGGSVSLQVTPLGGTFNSPLVSNYTFNAVNPGIFMIVYTFGSGSCAGSDTLWAEVIPQPVLQLSATSDLCLPGGSVYPYTPSPYNPLATYLINGVTVSSFPYNITVTNTAAQYTVFATVSNQCDTLIRTDTFEVAPPIQVSFQTPDISVCQGTSAPLQVAPLGGTFNSPSVSNYTFNAVNPGIEMIVYTLGSGLCSDSDTLLVEVIPQPVLQLSGTSDLCLPIGSTYDYTPSPYNPQVTYLINGVTVSSFPYSITVANTSAQYAVFATVSNQCDTLIRTDTFEVTPPIQVSFQTPDISVCQGTSAPLQVTPLGGTFNSPSVSNYTFNAVNPGIEMIVYTLGSGLCSDSDTLLVEVIPQPVLQLSATSDFCLPAGSVYPYTPSPYYPLATYLINGVAVSSFPYNITVTNTAAQYTVFATIANQCDTLIRTDTFEITPPIQVSFQTPDISVCPGTSTPLQVIPLGGTFNSPSVSNYTFNAVNPGTEMIIYTLGSGLCSDSDTLLVEILGALPALRDTIFCQGSPVPFSIPHTNTGFSENFSSNCASCISGSVFNPALMSGSTAEVYIEVVTPEGCIIKDTALYQKIITLLNTAQTGCSGMTYTADVISSSLNMSFSWDAGDGSPTTAGGSFSHLYAQAGNYEVVTFGTLGYCLITDTLFIEVAPLLAPSFVINDSICAGQFVTILNNTSGGGAGVGYNWNFGNGQTSTLAQPMPIQYSSLRDTTFQIEVTIVSNCETIQEYFNIFVEGTPTFQLEPDLQHICSGQLVGFSTLVTGGPLVSIDFGNGHTYLGTGMLVPDQTYFATGTNPQTYYITTFLYDHCDTISQIDSIVIYPSDVVSQIITNQTFTCQSEPICLQSFSTPGAPLYWLSDDGYNSSSGTFCHAFSTSGNHRIYLYVYGCGYATDSIDITVYPLPQVTVAAPSAICAGDTALIEVFGATTGTTVSIFPENSTDSVSTQSLYYIYHTPGIYTIVVNASYSNIFGNTCTFQTNTQITVRPRPTVSLSVMPNPVCQYASVTIGALSATGTSYQWSFSNGQISNLATATESFSTTGTNTAAVTVTDIYGCTTSADTTIYVQQTPTALFAFDSGNTICEGTLFHLINQSLDATGYTWTFPDGTTSTDTDEEWIAVPGIQNIVLVAHNGVCTDSFNLPITGSPQAPPLAFSQDIENLHCYGLTNGTASLFPQGGTPPYSINWQNNPATSMTITGLAAGIYPFTLTDALGCKLTDTLMVTQPNALILNTEVTPNPCFGESVAEIIPLAQGGTSPYLYALNQDYQNPIFYGLSEGDYMVSVMDINGCVDSQWVSITDPFDWSVEIDSSGLYPDTIYVYVGSTVHLSAHISINNFLPAVVAWLPTDGFNPSNEMETDYRVSESVSLILSITDVNGCNKFDTVYIKALKPLYYIPNAFTPNNDGENDNFSVYSHQPGSFEYFYMDIYTRWGDKVFSTDDIFNGGWDGHYKGQIMATEVLVYCVRFKVFGEQNERVEKGDLTLIR